MQVAMRLKSYIQRKNVQYSVGYDCYEEADYLRYVFATINFIRNDKFYSQSSKSLIGGHCQTQGAQ